ncbi:MAG: hypothetical protein ACRDA4_08070 [Filifactoraceae bacterium]
MLKIYRAYVKILLKIYKKTKSKLIGSILEYEYSRNLRIMVNIIKGIDYDELDNEGKEIYKKWLISIKNLCEYPGKGDK